MNSYPWMIHGSTYEEVRPNVWRTIWQFTCDQCKKAYAKEEKKERREKATHYCSLACTNLAQVKGGILDDVRKQGFRSRLGVDYPQQSQSVRNRSEQTCVERYRVKNVQQVADIKQRSCETFLAKLEKRQRSLGVWSSKAENVFYEQLSGVFGHEDVIRQKRFPGTRRPVDFFIQSINTYVQFDGVYWHGLDRPIEEIRNGKTKHDQEIVERWQRDREQDELALKENIRLVRVTDREFDTLSFESIVKRIKE